MKSIISMTAFASFAAAATINSRGNTLLQNFEFQSFTAACTADSNQCSYSFNLNGRGLCTASQPAFISQDAAGASYKALPNIGVTSCQDTVWTVTGNPDGGLEIYAKSDAGLSGTAVIPFTDLTIEKGLETYTGSGIVILYGYALSP
ncbi:unnamed protein product [Discula destructiva]